MELNICPIDDHVHEAERSIRTVKERIRCIMHGLPFKMIPRIMTRGVVVKAIKDLNQFPFKDFISDTTSTLSTMTGRPLPYYNKILIKFGTYIQVFEDNDPTNTTKSRTTPVIALNQTGNVRLVFLHVFGYWLKIGQTAMVYVTRVSICDTVGRRYGIKSKPTNNDR